MSSDVFFKVCAAIVQTFIYYGVGAMALKWKMIPAEALNGLSNFTVNLLTPCLIFYSVAANFTSSDAGTIFLLPLLGFSMVALHTLLGYGFVPWLKHKNNGRKISFLYVMAVNNYRFLPIIIVGNLWGSKHVGALLLWSVGTTIAQWSIGVAIMAGNDWKQLVRNILSPNLISAILALICVFTDWKVPEFGMQAIHGLGDMTVTLSLLLIGASLFSSKKRLFDYPADAIYTSFVRVVAVPLVTILIIKLVPLPELAKQIAVVIAVMPAASSAVLISRSYGGCPDFTGQMVLASTLASLITVPLFLGYIF